jgi:hypothetical protein
MKKTLLVSLVVLSAVLSSAGAGFAQDVQFKCCCNLECFFNYTILDPQKGLLKLQGSISITPCDATDLLFEDLCTSEFWANLKCTQARIAYKETYLDKLYGSENLIYMTFDHYVGSCTLDSACAATSLLGEEDPLLDTLRRFRDEVLMRSPMGKKLTELYYEYGPLIADVFAKNPRIKAHAREILEQIIPAVNEALEGNGTEVFQAIVSDEIFSEAVILLEEIDAAAPSLLPERLFIIGSDSSF